MSDGVSARVTRELVHDSRVLIQQLRLLVRNSNARMDRTCGALRKVRFDQLRRWLDQRDAA
jgi:hypothetical protein